MAHLLKMIFFFFRKTIKQILMYLLAPFITQNFEAIFREAPEYDDVPFSGQNGLFAQHENFFRKTVNVISMDLLTPFIVQNFKKILKKDQKLWGCTIFRPKMAQFSRNINFSEHPLVNLVAFIRIYLGTCKK